MSEPSRVVEGARSPEGWTEQDVEEAARALYEHEYPGCRWGEETRNAAGEYPIARQYREKARAVLAAVDAVPRAELEAALGKVEWWKARYEDAGYNDLCLEVRQHRERAERLEADLRTCREALRAAERALYDARCGLDLGLGCARDLEGDWGLPRATAERAARQEAYLERARAAHREARDALASLDREGER